MNKLTKYLVEGILQGAETGITVLLPGGFKPPHGGHLELALTYSKLPNVSEVKILVGPKEREGITREQSIVVWNELLIGARNITVQKVAEDNPLLAAYKYIETAEPGTYALAASSKGEDYERVKKFVQGHAKKGPYYKKNINVVELSANTRPLTYTGRKDGLNGKGVSASVLRKDLAAKKYDNFKTNYPGTSEDILKSVYSILTKKSVRESSKSSLTLPQLLRDITIYEDEMAQWFGRDLLLCGGAAGHLAHPYEDYDLTFEDVKNMIIAALSGTIESAQEKLDGQNLMVTYKDGQVRAARNKGHIKDRAANSLTTTQIKQTFANRGPIQAAFGEAMVDLETAINGLSPKQKEKFFGNGTKFINLEVLYPATVNVIPYGATQLRLHHIKEYDLAGNVVDEDVEGARELDGALRQAQLANQKTYDIRITDPVTVTKSADYEKQKSELLGQLSKLMGEHRLKMSNVVGDYYSLWWKDYIKNTGKQYGFIVKDSTMQQLVDRWAFDKKEVNIRVIRDGISNEDFKNWVVEFDKGGVAVQKKIAGRQLENIFLKLGVYTLQNIENLVALNPNQSVRKIKGDLKKAIEQIKSFAKTDTTDEGTAALRFLKRELTRLQDIGGFKAIMPTEGIVFKYSGKLYKLTGAFAPMNMLMGYLKY